MKPTILSGSDTVTVTGVAGVDIAGVAVTSSTGNGIDVTSALAGPATGATIHDNTVLGAAQEGIDVNADSAAGTTVLVSNTSITSAGNGFDVSSGGPAVVAYSNGTILSSAGTGIRMDGTVSGNLTVSGLANVTIDGNTAGGGISITTAKFDSVPGGAFNVVNAGTVTVGSAGNAVGAAGVTMSNVSGDLAFGTLTVFGGTSGVTITGSGLFTGAAGMRIANGGGSISAPAGVGFSATTATIAASGVTFTRIDASNGATGISLNTTGTGPFLVAGDGTKARNGSGGTITLTTNDGVALNSASNVTLQSMNITSTGDTNPGGVDASSASGDHAVQMVGGSGLVLSGVLVQSPRASGLLMLDVAGTNRVNFGSRFAVFSATSGYGMYIHNNNVNMALMELDGITMADNSSVFTNVFVANGGTANMQFDVKNGSVFEDLGNQALTVAAGGNVLTTGTLTSNIVGNIFRNAKVNAENNVGILVNNGATHVSVVDNNLFDNIAENGTIANTSVMRTQNNGGVMNATVKNNTFQNINYTTGGRHMIGHIFEPIAFNAGYSSTLDFDGNTATNNITFVGVNREFVFIDYRTTAAGGGIKIRNNIVSMPTPGTQQLIEFRSRQTNASTVNLSITGNSITGSASGLPFVDIDSETSATVNATVSGNTFVNAGVAQTVSGAAETAGTSSLCFNVTGNTLSAGTGTIGIDQTGTVRVPQANAAAIAAANGIPAANVVITGSPLFNQPVCLLP